MQKILLSILLFSSLFGWVGQITAIVGKSELIKDNNKTIPLKIGMKLEKKDIIQTQNGKIQITFKDNTIITIGKNTKIKISDYLFDNTPKSKATFHITKGLMKVIDGKIGKIAKKRFRIITKNSTIGIRGTIFIVEVNNDIVKVGMLEGETIFTPFNKKSSYIINKSEQLIYNPKQSKSIKIIKGFSEKKVNLTLKPKKKSTIDLIQNTSNSTSSTDDDTKKTDNQKTNNSEEKKLNKIQTKLSNTKEFNHIAIDKVNKDNGKIKKLQHNILDGIKQNAKYLIFK